jgi:hypothetical protein
MGVGQRANNSLQENILQNVAWFQALWAHVDRLMNLQVYKRQTFF